MQGHPGKQGRVSPHILRKLFDEYDKDGSGALDTSELKALLGHIGSNVRQEDLDTDNDQLVTFEELQVLCAVTGRHTHPIFKAALDTLAPPAHQDNSVAQAFAGSAQDNEAFHRRAAKGWRTLASIPSFDETAMKQAFRRIDVNNDNSLTTLEIRRAIKEVAPSLTEIDITLMIATADRDKSGQISLQEFMDMVLYNKEDSIEYWEKYGVRDMHVQLGDRSDQIARR